MANDNKQKLYDALSQDYDMGSYEQFCADLNDDSKRRKLYNAMSQDYDLGTWEGFSQQLGYDQAATSVPASSTPAPAAAPEQPKSTSYFKLRRGGKDFTVSTDEVNAAGGLYDWAKAHPGAPLRVYMQGTNENGKPFDGHVDLSVAHDRSKKRGYTYTTTSKPIETPPQKPWEPTRQQKMAMSMQLQQLEQQSDAFLEQSRERTQNMSDYYRSNRSLGFQTVEGKPVFNQETGKMEKTYLTPTGDRTTSKVTADMETHNFHQAIAAADMSVGAQIRRAETELAELRKRADERGSVITENYRRENKSYFSQVAQGMQMMHGNTPVSAGPNRAIIQDKEFNALTTAIRQREEQLKDLYEERDRQVGKDVGFWRGFGRVMGDVRTWDFGMGDMRDALTMLNADHYLSPNATDGERKAGEAMMRSIYDKQQTEEMFGGNASFWNRAGVMAGYMPSFMLDFVSTGGGYEMVNLGAKAATRGAVKLIGKEAVKEMTELGVKAYAKKYGVRGVGRMAENWTIKALGATADDLLIRAPLMTNTVQIGKTAADIIDRKLGDVVIDENGNYDFSNDKTWGSAVWQGEANSIIENYSEMFGTHLDGVVPSLAKTFGGKRISGILARANASGYGQILATTRRQFERLGVSDYFGEVSEEYYGQLWRSMLNLDDAYTNAPVLDKDGNQVLDAEGNPVYERKNLLFTGQFHGDIWGGMALSMGLMGGGKYTISGVAYANMKHQVNKADKRAAEIFTPDRWEPIREIIDNTTNEDMGVLAESMVNDQNLSDDERTAVMEYMERSLNLRGHNLGEMAKSRSTAEGDETQIENIELDSELSQSYIDGYEASSSQEMNDAQNMYEFHRQRVEGMFQPDMLDRFDSAPVTALMDISQSGLFSQEEIDAARDYINAKTVRDGILRRVNDNIDEQIAQSNAKINGCINTATGMIQPVLMGRDGRQVYVVGGSLAVNPDGTIDRDASDESIVVRDLQTGELEFIAPKSIVSALEEIDPEMERAAAADNIRQQAAQAAANAMNGTLAFNPGDVVTIMGEYGPLQGKIIVPTIDDERFADIDLKDPNQVAVLLDDGTPLVYTKEQLQAFADAANLERLNNFEQERNANRAQQHATEAEALRPQFALNDEFTILNDTDTPIRGSVTGELDDDGTVEIYTEEPINGNRVNRFTPAELEDMFDTYNGVPVATTIAVPENADNVPKPTGNPESDAENSENPTGSVPKPETEAQQSALSRIPVDEQGQPKYDEADPETAWDAIVEQAQGDETIAAEVVADIVADREEDFNAAEKAYNKTKEGKPEKRKKGDPIPTMAERIAAKNAAKEALAEAKAIRDAAKEALDHWKKIADTTRRRKSERSAAEDAEARYRSQKRAEEEARLKAEREEAERIKREALNGVPDWNIDTPDDARARGYRRNGSQQVDRPEVIDNHALGKSVEVKFGDNVMPTGNIAVIEASQLQPSHRDGQRNPAHFLDEAQPKERKDAASRFAAAKIAETIRPEEITSSVTAYTGAPSINSRGEVIQGNNRSEALRVMYERFSQSADKYKQYLIDHAAEFGLTPEAIATFEQPVLVNMLDVSDEDAITLGQYVAQDTESGGIERIKPKNAVQKMGDKIRTFANILLRSSDDEATFAQLVDANGLEVLKWMNQQGYITNTQYASAFDSKGNLSAEAANDLKGIMYQSIFSGGSTRLEEMFNKMPTKAQRAILATAFRDYDSPFADRMINEIQQSIIAFNALLGYEQFRDATTAEAIMFAVETWKVQLAFDDVTGDPYLPSETFSNFALALAAMYKGKTQKHIQSVFNMMYDIVQGTGQDNLFEVADKTPKPLAEAIRRVLNIEYKPIVKPTTDNGGNGSIVLDINSKIGQDGRSGSDGNPNGAEQSQEEAEPSDNGERTEGDSGQSGLQGKSSEGVREAHESGELRSDDRGRNAGSIEERESNIHKNQELNYQLSDEVDENGRQFVLNSNGKIEFGEIREESGLPAAPIKLSEGYQDEDGKGYGLVHIEANHGEQIRNAGFASVEEFVSFVAKNYDEDNIRVGKRRDHIGTTTYLIQVTDEHDNTLFIELSRDGSYWNVNSGGIFRKGYSNKKETVVKTEPQQPNNAVSTGSSLSENDESGISIAEPNGEPTVSADKDTTKSPITNDLGEKIAKEEEKVNVNPTEKQKEAGNYKKGHVQVGTFNVTIENPKGSVRSGVDANGKEWETTMQNTYGYIRGTEGVDGDHIDVFLSDDIDGWKGRRVVIVDQYNPDGSFDEHKVMLGFNEKDDAIDAYLANYEKGWEKGRRLVFSTAILEDFEKWIESSHRKQKPYHEYKIADKAEVDESTPENPVSATDCTIDTYTTKKNKTYHRVVFPRADKEVWQERLNLAKKMGGTSVPKGYGFKTREEAEAFAKAVDNPETVADGSRLVHFESVTVQRDGMEVSISSHEAEGKAIKKEIKAARQETKAETNRANRTDKSDGRRRPVMHHGAEAEANRAVYEAGKGLLESAGIKVHEVSDAEAEAMLGNKNTPFAGQPNRANEKLTSGSVLLSISGNSSSNRAASKEADTKLQNKTLRAKNKIAKFRNGDYSVSTETLDKAMAGIGKMFAMDTKGGTRYTVLKAENGDTIALRLGDHAANGNNFARDNADQNVSIVIERKRYDTPDSEIEFTEATITEVTFKERPQEVVNAIVDGVDGLLRGNEFTLDESIGTVERKGEYGREEFTNFLSNRKPQQNKSVENTQSSAHRPNAEVSDARIEQKFQIGHSESEASSRENSAARLRELDRQYLAAVERGDMEAARKMVNEAAERSGYSADSDYQGTSAFNGVAPCNGYGWSKAERKDLWVKDEFEGDWTLGDQIDGMGTDHLDFMLFDPNGERSLSEFGRESARALRKAYRNPERKITVYRSVPSDVKEGALRDGDWVTPSRSYAKDNAAVHGWGRKYRIIEQEVDVDELWWDGNDINEWGYDSGSNMGYRNTKNNRKSLDAVTYDDNGNVIPLSKRFDSRKSDTRYLRTAEGRVYGWTVDGEVYLNRDAMNPETPVHEYTHLWDEMVRKENPELWERGKELMKQTPVWDEVMSDPNYSDIRGDEDAVASEVHARLTGRDGSKLMQEMIDKAKKQGAIETAKAVNLIENLKSWFAEMFNALKKTLSKWSKRDLEELTVEDFNRMTMRDMTEGLNPRSGDKNLVAVHNMSEAKLMDALDLGGLPMPSIAITKANMGHGEFGEISLVFGRESIDPTDRRNKVYGGDAWTPMFPSIGYKLNDAKTAEIYSRARAAGNLPFLNPVHFYPDNYERKIEGTEPDNLVEVFKDDFGAKQLYLSEQGRAVEKMIEHNVEKYTPRQIEIYEALLKEIGQERLSNESRETLEPEVKRVMAKFRNVDNMKPFLLRSLLSNSIHKALDYAENGNQRTEGDISATQEEINRRIDNADYREWLEKLFEGVVEKRGIRNERDRFTPSGSARKWETLYDAVTLDNVVKAMQRQAAKGGNGLFGGDLFGAAAKEFRDIEELRNDAERRIKSMPEAGYQEAKKEIEKRLESLSERAGFKGFEEQMNFEENVRDAVAKSDNARAIYNHLRHFYPEMRFETAEEIAGIVHDIQELSTRYFEAKPQRAVGFEEVKLAVVPDGTSDDIVRRLEDMGIPVKTYERGNERQRQAVISRETSQMVLRFHAAMAHGGEEFDALRERAVKERGIIAGRTMDDVSGTEKLDEKSQKVLAGFLSKYNSAPIVVVSEIEDIWRMEFPEEVREAFEKELKDPETAAVFNHYDKKVYIFAKRFNGYDRKRFTLLHENVHGAIDEYGDYPSEFLDSFRRKVLESGYESELLELLDNIVKSEYEDADVWPEEYFASVIPWMIKKSERERKIMSLLTEEERAFVNEQILNKIRDARGRQERERVENGSIEMADAVHTPRSSDRGSDGARISGETLLGDEQRGGGGVAGVPAGRGRGVRGGIASEDGTPERSETQDDVVYRTSAEIDAEYPNWLAGTTTDSGKHSTQVEGTRKTYCKIGDWIETNLGKDVDILDASSGMGYGTADLRMRGFNIEDVEPYQSEKRKAENPATYDSYGKIEKQYDFIISNAVLNVIPDDWRRDVLHDMASRLKAGGKLFINTRKAGEEKGIKDKIELDSPQEVLVKRNGKIASYQRFFTSRELKEWVESELGDEYTVEIANKTNSGTKGLAAVLVTKDENVNRHGDGYGSYTDDELSYENDPVSKAFGKNRFSKKRQAEFAARERMRMVTRVQELAERMHLDKVEILTDASQLEGKRATAKGFYNKRTGKITIVIPNNASTIDAEQTLLHEAVAHYGLRKLFGEHFNTFLDNVYESADPEIRRKITEMAAKNGWDFRTATEEYLAGLAEEMNYDEAKAYGGWWSRIKRLFLDMIEKIGFVGFRDKTGIVITDNELRYLLWRSYENLRGRDRGIFSEAADISKQSELKVGNYAEQGIDVDYAAEPSDIAEINEVNNTFNEQLHQQINHTLPRGHIYQLGRPGKILRSTGIPDLPIQMSAQ